MGLTKLPLEIKCMILESIPQRHDLAAWYHTCKDTRSDLRRYCDNLVQTLKHRHGHDITSFKICTSSPEIFLAWMRAESRTDSVIVEQSHELFYT